MNSNEDGTKALGNNEVNNEPQGGSKFQIRHGRALLLSGLILLVVLGGLELLISQGKLFKEAEKTKPTTEKSKYNTSLEENNDTKISTDSTSVNATVTESVKTNTAQNSQTKELGIVEQTLVIRDPVEIQATFNIAWGDESGKNVEIILIHPDGRQIEIAPVDIQTSIDYELEKKSFQDKSEQSSVFKLFPSDPLVAPLPGEWTMRVTAPVGTHLVFGVLQL